MLLYFQRNSAKKRNTPHTTHYRYMIMTDNHITLLVSLMNNNVSAIQAAGVFTDMHPNMPIDYIEVLALQSCQKARNGLNKETHEYFKVVFAAINPVV